MKRIACVLLVALVFVVVASVLVPRLAAQPRIRSRARAAQPPEAQALLTQEWARAHALPGR